MFIDKNQNRWQKPYSKGTTEIDGVRYPNTVWDDADFRASQGVTEIPDPQLPEGVTYENHYVHQLDVPPYLEWTPKSDFQIAQQSNAKIDSLIDSLERASLMPRATREFMRTIYLQQAATLGVTEAQLLDVADAAYSPAYVKLHSLDLEIAQLRKQKVVIPEVV